MSPTSRHYHYTGSVSSLSESDISLVTSSDDEYDQGQLNDSRCSQWTPYTTSYSCSRTDRLVQQRSTPRIRGDAGDRERARNRGTPSPLEPDTEDEEDEHEKQPLVRPQYLMGRIGSRQWEEDIRRSVRPTMGTVSHSHSRAESKRQSPGQPATTGNTKVDRSIRQLFHASGPVSSDSHSFPRFFPSNLPLSIFHPATDDGNLNLAVEAATQDGPVTLFHMRMFNLKARDFSFRRYGRENGREICHSTREKKMLSSLEEKPGKATREGNVTKMTRRFSHAFSKSTKVVNARQHDQARQPAKLVTASSVESDRKPSGKPDFLRRVDSGYSSGSMSPRSPTAAAHYFQTSQNYELEQDRQVTNSKEVSSDASDFGYSDTGEDEEDGERGLVGRREYLPKNLIKLEFANFTHLDLRRHESLTGVARYDFEYWGVKYSWKSLARSQSSAVKSQAGNWNSTPGNFRLYVQGQSYPAAAMVPDELSEHAARLEARLGSWVPPCTMRIIDEDILGANNATDVCDIIVATGVLALTDDCIRRKWGRRESTFDRVLDLVPRASKTMSPKWLLQA